MLDAFAMPIDDMLPHLVDIELRTTVQDQSLGLDDVVSALATDVPCWIQNRGRTKTIEVGGVTLACNHKCYLGRAFFELGLVLTMQHWLIRHDPSGDRTFQVVGFDDHDIVRGYYEVDLVEQRG